MAIRIGPDREISAKVRLIGAQPTAGRAVGGRSPASRRADRDADLKVPGAVGACGGARNPS